MGIVYNRGGGECQCGHYLQTAGLRRKCLRPQNKLITTARSARSPVFTQASPNHTLVRDLDRCSENVRQRGNLVYRRRRAAGWFPRGYVQHTFTSKMALALPLGGNREWGSRFLSYLGILYSVEHTPLAAKQHYTPLF